jgi:predicted ATPase/class 3 adenylate cyclase
VAQLPTGTVTFLFTDIEGSTHLLQQLGDRYAEALGEHQALLRATFATHGGVEVDTQGDAFFVAFPTAPAAVAAAAQATRALTEHSWPEGTTVRVRVGLHTGTLQLVGDHYVGLDVHRAARIAAAGHGGQVLLSESTRVLTEQDLPGGAMLRDLGAHRLKDLQEPEPLYQLVLPDLPADFPPLKTLDAHPHNLVVQPTALLGREVQLTAVAALLRREAVRLVTLTGPGGIGKTRLAVQVAAEVLDDFPDGVWFVRLSRLTDPSLVVPTIAQTLGLKEADSQPIAETLREHLQTKRVLLVLDNFEQVVGAAPEVAALRESAPHLKVLVTSRVVLHLRGEREYPLGPLPLPDPGHLPSLEGLSQYAAVSLLIERAQEARPDFAITTANAPAIAEVCARLDGLPLAIELAAARVRLLPPEALLARLSAQLKLLTGGARDAEERQRTMRSAIAWSEALLTPRERVLFRRLAVCVGGWTLEAAEAVCTGPDGAERLSLDILEGLSTLVEQSLVQQREESGEARFGLLHVIREYALEQLETSGEAEALHRAHTAYYLTLTEQTEGGTDEAYRPAWRERMEREHDNLRAALDWTLQSGAAETMARLGVALGEFWVIRGHWNEGRRWLERALAVSAALPRPHARLLRWVGYLVRMQGDYAVARSLLTESVTRYRALEDTAGLVDALVQLAYCVSAQDDLVQAEQLFAESLVLSQATGDQVRLLSTLQGTADLAEARGDYAASQRLWQQALTLAQRLGDTHAIARCQMSLGWHALLRGEAGAAEATLQEALAVQRQLGDTNCSAHSLCDLGVLALERGNVPAALGLLDQSLVLFQEIVRNPGVARTLAYLGLAYCTTGDVQQAADAYLAGLRIDRMLANRRRAAGCLDGLAEVALVAGEPERAARLLGAASGVRGVLPPLPLPPALTAKHERVLLDVRQALGEDAWAAAYAAGQALTLEQAIAEAREETNRG